jgi:hypothetical protein
VRDYKIEPIEMVEIGTWESWLSEGYEPGEAGGVVQPFETQPPSAPSLAAPGRIGPGGQRGGSTSPSEGSAPGSGGETPPQERRGYHYGLRRPHAGGGGEAPVPQERHYRYPAMHPHTKGGEAPSKPQEKRYRYPAMHPRTVGPAEKRAKERWQQKQGGMGKPGEGQVGTGRQATAQAVAEEWRKQGMSESGIAGVMANIESESGFKPGMLEKHPSGHAKQLGGGHGLYQFTGTEWQDYNKWLGKTHPGGAWTNPRYQSQYTAEEIKAGKGPLRGLWETMKAGPKERAAQAFVRQYERPRADLRARREAQYGRGVPPVEHYTGTKYAGPGSGGEAAGAPPGGIPGGRPLPANQAQRLGLSPRDPMTWVSSPSGARWQVNRRVAPQFTGFLKDLEATGYRAQSSGGYAYRPIRGSHRLSQHAYGSAIDIDAAHNPLGSSRTNLPRETSGLARKWGLSWGAEWRGRKDPMHFEASRFVADPGNRRQNYERAQ